MIHFILQVDTESVFQALSIRLKSLIYIYIYIYAKFSLVERLEDFLKSKIIV